jgi:hypothetical protein
MLHCSLSGVSCNYQYTMLYGEMQGAHLPCQSILREFIDDEREFTYERAAYLLTP